MSWRRTVIAFFFGAVGAGAIFFALLGVVGGALSLGRWNPWLPFGVIAVAGALDWAGVRAPGPRRQVNEDWLGRYRDWVIGLGFGSQLGLGFATIIPSFGTWAMYAIAMTAGMPLAPLLGAAFGLGRSLLLLSTRGIGSTSALARVMQQFNGAEGKARRLALAGYGLVLITVGVNVA